MKPGASAFWRAQGELAAYDHGMWEFRARGLCSSANQLISIYDTRSGAPDFDTIMCLPSATFLLSLSIELISKAYYLRAKRGPREAIYSHGVLDLFDENFFTEEQKRLMSHAEGYVVWAGRYPTPVWKKEESKETFDVPSIHIDGRETIDCANLPNAASRARIDQLLALFRYIQKAWSEIM